MMTALVAALSTAAILAGVLLVVLSSRVSSRRGRRSRSALPEARRKVLLLLGVGFVVGIFVAMFTGLVVAVLVTPVAFVGVPYLLGGGNGKYRIQRLEALESWTRTLTGLSVTGATIEQALSASYATAPKEIKTELQHFLQRLDAGWSTSKALSAFANELDDPTADFIVAVLAMSTTMRGPGLADALEDLAGIVAQEAQTRRSIEADRAKPRSTARWVTIIVTSGLVCFALTGYLSPYAETASGQALLAVFIACFVLLLLWMKSIAKDKPSPRILEVTQS